MLLYIFRFKSPLFDAYNCHFILLITYDGSKVDIVKLNLIQAFIFKLSLQLIYIEDLNINKCIDHY